MYGNYYPNGPYMSPNRQFESPYQPRQEVIRVNGRNGAEVLSRKLAPNSSALALDENEPIVWSIVTDGAGYPSIMPYSIAPYKESGATDIDDLKERIAKLEEVVNVKSNTSNAKQERSDETE